MTSTAADLVEHVLPDVPLRQLVLTLPFELRARLAYDGELLGAVTRTFVDSVLAWYQRQARARGVPGGKSGAVTVVQRVNSDLRLSPHLHSLFLDGVFTEDEGGELVFHPLPFLTNDDVGGILQIVRARVLALLRRKGVIEDDAVARDAKLADSEPALAALAAASVTGTLPAGPALRRRDPIQLRCEAELHTKALCATEGGFSLHAATTARAGDAAGREALCASTSCARRSRTNAPSSLATTSCASSSRGRSATGPSRSTSTRSPSWCGSRPRCHLPASTPSGTPACSPPPASGEPESFPLRRRRHPRRMQKATRVARRAARPAARRRRTSRPPIVRDIALAELLMRAFKIDVERCDNCGGRMKLRHLVMATASIERYLAWLGEPSDPPRLAPARGPPYFKHPAIRRRLADPGEPAQAELFDAH
ncbi:MAG: transposase [Myxococcales bacterium]|nr:transposase [Myxococcales bacterium]